jgi:hypothetical protein
VIATSRQRTRLKSPRPSSTAGRSDRRRSAGRAARQDEDESGRAESLVVPAIGATCDEAVLDAALDDVLLDLKAADAGKVNWLAIGVPARSERVEVLGARPPLEDIDPGGIDGIG